MKKIESIALNIFDAAQTGYEIYISTARAMDSLENSGMNGKSKLESVLSMIKGMFIEVYENWSYWSELLIKFISSIKSIYNLVK